MSAYVPFDEFRLIVLAPADLEESVCAAIQRTLESQLFRSALRQVVRQYPDLDQVRVRISG